MLILELCKTGHLILIGTLIILFRHLVRVSTKSWNSSGLRECALIMIPTQGIVYMA